MLISMNISLLVQAKDEFKKQALKNGVYVIQSMVSNNEKVLDISKADTKSGAEAIIWDFNQRANQAFYFDYNETDDCYSILLMKIIN